MTFNDLFDFSTGSSLPDTNTPPAVAVRMHPGLKIHDGGPLIIRFNDAPSHEVASLLTGTPEPQSGLTHATFETLPATPVTSAVALVGGIEHAMADFHSLPQAY